jgi:hypothetical protein
MPDTQCHQCGAVVRVDEPLARDADCESCGADLRCCLNCRHYDTHFNNSCRENQADPVVDKNRRNFCEFFSFTRERFVKAGSGREAEARKKLEGLFGAAPGADSSGADEAKKRLESLFRKGDAGGPKRPT